jgi:putative acetyltransferase
MLPPPPFRLATDADGPAIARVIAGVFADYPDCPFVPKEFPELAAPATHYARLGGALFVAEHEGAVLGCFGLKPSPAPATVELVKVYLAKPVRGRGWAAAMLDHAAALARARGATRLELFSDTRFAEGHRFYERHGFRRLPALRFLADAGRSWEYHYERDL